MRIATAAFLILAIGCGGTRSGRGVGGGGDGGATEPPDPNGDRDHDGYTSNQGDCDDTQALINPGAFDVPGNSVDDDCNGKVDDEKIDCDATVVGQKDATALVSAVDQCGMKFVRGAHFSGPSDQRARAIVKSFGVVKPRKGESMVLLSTGIAAAKGEAGYTKPQIGTELDDGNTAPNPEPTLPGVKGCSQSQPAEVNDYTEWVVKLTAPTNAKSLEFDFQFFSAEYPEFVCTEFNDEFLVQLESSGEFQKPRNISFDDKMNPITVNNGFFTICQNSSKPQTKNCKRPVTDIGGTGYEDTYFNGEPSGGSTGWLTTTAPVTPGQELTLHFIIFDEGDHIYDSAVLVDNFRWSVDGVDAPMTIQ